MNEDLGTVVRERVRTRVVHGNASEAVYGLGLFGAWFYYIGHATSFACWACWASSRGSSGRHSWSMS